MFTSLRLPMLLVATITGVLLFANSAKADYSDRRMESLDRLVTRLERESQTLSYELRRYGFRDLSVRVAFREVNDISRQASHIHSLLHSGSSLRHIHADVVELQEAIHHVHEHLAPYDHFNDHVEKMDDLSHAMDDILHSVARRHTTQRHTVERYPVERPVYEYGPSRGNGVTFGNGGFSVRIGR